MLNKLMVGVSGLLFAAALVLLVTAPSPVEASVSGFVACDASSTGACTGGCGCNPSLWYSSPDCRIKHICVCNTILGAPVVPEVGPHAKGGQWPDGIFPGVNRPTPNAKFPEVPQVLVE